MNYSKKSIGIPCGPKSIFLNSRYKKVTRSFYFFWTAEVGLELLKEIYMDTMWPNNDFFVKNNEEVTRSFYFLGRLR